MTAKRDPFVFAHEHRDEIARRYPKILRRVMGYNLDDFTGELVPDHDRGLHATPRPLVPLVDVDVGTAHPGAAHADQHLDAFPSGAFRQFGQFADPHGVEDDSGRNEAAAEILGRTVTSVDRRG